jgi:large subunit ribosomal protein L25
MKALPLEATVRTITGHRVKDLRKEGLLPATIYGKTITPLTIQVNQEKFVDTFKQSGETGLISLTVDNEAHPVLVKNVEIDPVTSVPMHIEFQQVNLKEKIHANIPVVIIGESQAVKEKTGTLLQLLNEVEVEALPTDLPEKIDADITVLANVNDHMLVKQLSIPENVTLVTDPEIMVVKIGELVAPEPEPVAAAPAEGEVAPGSEAPAEGSEEKGTEPAPTKPQESPKKE